MTIGAAFKCGEGIVLCADSQETIGELKIDVPKLLIRPSNGSDNDNIRTVFVGAGSGPLIDKLADELWKAAKQSGGESLSDAIGSMQDCLLEWHRKIISAYTPQRKPEAELLIGICCKDGFGLYKSVGPIINKVESYEIVGIGEILGKYLSDQTYRHAGSLYELTMIGLYVVANANKYVDGCGGDIHLAWIRIDGSIEIMKPYETRAISEGLLSIADDLHYLLLQAGTFRPGKTYIAELLEGIKKTVIDTRKEIGTTLRASEFFKKKLLRPPKYKLETMYRRIEWPPFA